MKVVVAIDSLKGCLTSADANAAAREGVLLASLGADVLSLPVSDGGEGWLDAFQAAQGGERVRTLVLDPLLRLVEACYLIQGERAVIEVAQACGLTLLHPEERDPLVANTYGVGQLIADALDRGCRHFLIGLGGTATSDAGRGMVQALTEHLQADRPEQLASLVKADFTIATDVDNPLCGPCGAATVFGPQKGATPAAVEELDRHAHDFAQEAARRMHTNCSQRPGAGAAGGLGYAFMQFLTAESCSGIGRLLDELDFDARLANADLVITGEGRADSQTLMGKLPTGILRRAQARQVPVLLIAGQVSNRDRLLGAGFADVVAINPPDLPIEQAMQKETARKNIRETVRQSLSAVLAE